METILSRVHGLYTAFDRTEDGKGSFVSVEERTEGVSEREEQLQRQVVDLQKK